MWLTSIAGGTDVCTAFVGGVPIVPVVAGEISCRYLGAAVDAFDAHGASVRNEEGELVVTEPMPSMPLRFWDDRDGTAYRSSYFERFPGVWCHGDWLTITDRGSCIITGRSDATLNRGGVRLGTSEFYEVVEALPDIADSLVVHLEGQGNGEILLFVQTAPGTLLDGRLRELIVSVLRTGLSPRHIPDEIYAVPAIPRTHSGKKLEVPMKRILMGARSEDALTAGGLANQSALHAFEAIRDSRAHPAT